MCSPPVPRETQDQTTATDCDRHALGRAQSRAIHALQNYPSESSISPDLEDGLKGHLFRARFAGVAVFDD
jgi:hypothetical protein